MRIISYIPIRSGSRGLKDKNILNVADKPLFAWSIFFAKELSCLGDIIVSSDSNKYLELANKYNINTEKRPIELALDSSTTESAIVYTLNKLLKENKVTDKDYFCLIQATSPIRRRSLSNQLKKLISTNYYDSVITVNKETSFEWMYDSKECNTISPKYDLGKRPMRQVILKNNKERLIENGSFYCSRISSIIKSNLRVSGRIGFVTCNEYENLEIDNKEEYSLVDCILREEITKGNTNNFAYCK